MSQITWQTQADDMAFAEATINKHIELNEGEPIGLFEIIIKPNESIDVCVADWVIELSEHFDEKYGEEQGAYITKMIVGRCLTRGETLH